ncbi:MAG TPA: DUF4097 family beta strand repeat-containing protein [Pseudomonadales bacterium]|nr:DUF4097 family beta strand repeat-containing protein [Pseudomonadales bacterium]
MRRLYVQILALVLLAVSGQALAARQKVDESKAATADGFVKIVIVRGHLRVEGWDKNSIHVSGLLDDQTREFVFNVDKDYSTIEVRLPEGRSGWWNNTGSDLVVQVPRNSRLEVSVVSTDTDIRDIQGGVNAGTVSGDLTVEKVGNKADLTTVSGDIQLRDASGRISAKSVSGNVNVTDAHGNLKLHSVSGDIVARDADDEFEFETISGDIEATHVTYKHAGGNSVSGDFEIYGKMMPAGSLDFDSVSGSVRAALNPDVEARFDLEVSSGSITNQFTDDKPRASRYGGSQSLRFIKGSGKAEVSLTSRSGDIILSKH